MFIYLFTLLYWFCHTLTWISHGCTCVLHPEPLSHISPHPSPHPIPLGHPRAPAPICLVAQLYLTFCDHTDCSLPDSSVHGIFQARTLKNTGAGCHFLLQRVFPTQVFYVGLQVIKPAASTKLYLYKAGTIYILALHRKSLPTSDLENEACSVSRRCPV